jgi:hypothetical protein
LLFTINNKVASHLPGSISCSCTTSDNGDDDEDEYECSDCDEEDLEFDESPTVSKTQEYIILDREAIVKQQQLVIVNVSSLLELDHQQARLVTDALPVVGEGPGRLLRPWKGDSFQSWILSKAASPRSLSKMQMPTAAPTPLQAEGRKEVVLFLTFGLACVVLAIGSAVLWRQQQKQRDELRHQNGGQILNKKCQHQHGQQNHHKQGCASLSSTTKRPAAPPTSNIGAPVALGSLASSLAPSKPSGPAPHVHNRTKCPMLTPDSMPPLLSRQQQTPKKKSPKLRSGSALRVDLGRHSTCL